LDSPLTQVGGEAAWSPDSRTVAISGVYLPLEGTYGEEREMRRSAPFVVEVGIQSSQITKISHEDFRVLKWGRTDGVVVEARSTSGPRFTFRKGGEEWVKVADKTEALGRPQIVLKEDMNNRPKILAVDPITHQTSILLDLNPQFEDLRFARVEEIQWNGSDGHIVRGGLYYPVDYVSGTRYPLVIQTHGWESDRFWIDGPWTSAFAAQALAGKNFVVLQVPDPDENVEQTSVEVTRTVAAFEGAIDQLDREGLVDSDRVGLIGFSRTGLYVRYALTHSHYHFAAASVMDSNDGGYFQYLVFSNSNPDFTEYDERINGGLPFGAGANEWMERSPGFAVDKVQTPFRIVSPRGGDSLLMEWEWFAALTRLGKPVEMVMLEDGEHVLQKPWDRMVSQQGNVDWFCFWLKDEEDPDPAKAAQYARWRELRKLQEANAPLR
jgi:Prolyl oligopeptidase family